MDSKILIDITPMGVPHLFIRSVITDDLRDKVLSRFIYDSGAGMKNGAPLKLNIIHNEDGLTHAIVEHVDTREVSGSTEPPLKIADDWAVKNMPPDLYVLWTFEVMRPSRNS